MNNPEDYIGTEDICVECGETKLIVALDWDGLPVCFDCATKDMPKGRVENDVMPLLIRDAQLQLETESGGVQVDTKSQDENDRPKACSQDQHDYVQNVHGAFFCPFCGERLSS